MDNVSHKTFLRKNLKLFFVAHFYVMMKMLIGEKLLHNIKYGDFLFSFVCVSIPKTCFSDAYVLKSVRIKILSLIRELVIARQ